MLPYARNFILNIVTWKSGSQFSPIARFSRDKAKEWLPLSWTIPDLAQTGESKWGRDNKGLVFLIPLPPNLQICTFMWKTIFVCTQLSMLNDSIPP